jgi:hypothetical protein
MAAVAAMDEQVQNRAEQYEGIGQESEHMPRMHSDQIQRGKRQENQQSYTGGRPKKAADTVGSG